MAITGWGNFRPLPRIRQDGPMADHPHTIDRWDDATGENLIEQIARRRRLSGRAGDVPGGREAMARCQDHAAQSGAGHRAKLGGLAAWLQCVPLKGGGIIIRSVRSGTTW